MTDQNSKPKWTPGPWRFENYFVRSELHDSSHEICTIDLQWGENRNGGKDNGYLIAAAPDYDEACSEGSMTTPDWLDWLADRMVEVYGESPNVDFVLATRRKAEKLRKAMTKARGESND